MDTIFALASARGKSGVAVFRVSGPLAFEIAERLCGTPVSVGRPSLRILRDLQGEVIDQALVLAFADGHSFTGETVVEFQTHGSPAVIAALARVLTGMTGVRQAEPGEFTRRALENNRLDLAEVEGLSDLIEAETEAQKRQALRVFSGELSHRAEGWRRDLIRAAALIEATIDFVDEDVPVDVMPEVLELLDGVTHDMRSELSRIDVSERIRDGFTVAIVGPPNTGKSTLLNHLAGREAALVSDTPGTTRDVIEVRFDLRGIPVTLMDTAGLRESEDVVEAMGIERTRGLMSDADVRIFLTDDPETQDKIGPDDLVLLAKDDSGNSGGVSGKTGAGVAPLLDHLTNVFSQRAERPSVLIRERHQVAVQRGIENLSDAKALIDQDSENSDLIAQEIRFAVAAVESLVGRVDVEHILDEVFSRFCLGK